MGRNGEKGTFDMKINRNIERKIDIREKKRMKQSTEKERV